MAEMIFKDLIYDNSKRYLISCESMATSMEELGNDIYPKAKKKLLEMGVKVEAHRARQFKKSDYKGQGIDALKEIINNKIDFGKEQSNKLIDNGKEK